MTTYSTEIEWKPGRLECVYCIENSQICLFPGIVGFSVGRKFWAQRGVGDTNHILTRSL